MCVCANYQNTPTPWQQHQAASFRESLGRRRGKASPFLSQADMWCSCWAVTRTHHTHRLHSHPSMHRLNPPPPPLPHSPPLMSISLLAATCQHSHQSLSVCLAGRINGMSLEQVLIQLQCTRLEPPDLNILLHLANFMPSCPVNFD